MGALLAKLKSLFSGRKLEVILIGLENSGKTTLVNQLQLGTHQSTAPTIGLNVKNFKRGVSAQYNVQGVNMKVWDIGGQVQFRSEWGNYAKGCDVMLFLLDASNPDSLGISKKELHQLLEDPELGGIPILVIGNKTDLKPHLNQEEIVQGLNLDYIYSNEWLVVMTSALKSTNLQSVVDWLLKAARR